MRVSLLVFVVAITVVAVSAYAQGRIGLYRDVDMASCAFADKSPSILSVHVVHSGSAGKAAEFRLQPRAGATLMYLAESLPVTSGGSLGRADSGVAVLYGGCQDPPIHVMTVLYQGYGLSGDCAEIALLNDPRSRYVNADHVAFVNCNSEIQWAEAGNAVVNPDDDCQCGKDPGDGTPLPVEVTTWGSVKALYSE